MIVVADTGPINYLILIGEIELLPALYDRVAVPPSVCEELGRLRAPRRDVVRVADASRGATRETRQSGATKAAGSSFVGSAPN